MISASLGYILALCASACWAQNSIAYALAGRRVGSQTVTHARLWFAVPAILVIHWLAMGSWLPTGIDSTSFVLLALSGVLGFCITDMCIFKALVDIGPRETSVIMGLTPIISAVLSWLFLGEHLAALQIAGILVTVTGVTWVVVAEGSRRRRHRHLWIGLAAGLAGAFLQAVTMLLAKKGMPEGTHPISGSLVRLVFGFLGVTVVAVLRRAWREDVRRMSDRVALFQIGTGAMVGPVMGMIFALYALSAAPVGVAMALMQLTPLFLLPVDVLFFKKKLGVGAIVGTFLAVAGTIILFLS